MSLQKDAFITHVGNGLILCAFNSTRKTEGKSQQHGPKEVMKKPDIKLTFIQLLMLCIAVMICVSISDGLSLCMPVPEAPEIAGEDALAKEAAKAAWDTVKGDASIVISLLLGIFLGGCVWMVLYLTGEELELFPTEDADEDEPA